jgi:uridine phosphorylase
MTRGRTVKAREENELLKSRGAVKPLGSHTAIGHLHEFGEWKDIPYLKDNHGMLPPFIIAVGSRVRVMKAESLLKLRDAVNIDSAALNLHGLSRYGRVAIVVGKMRTRDLYVPIAVVETQMGCSATQINLKEMLYFARHDGYQLDGGFVRSDAAYVIRAGTCAGVNSFAPSEVKVGIGDILIATESYGSIGALIQSTMRSLNYTGVNIAEKADLLRKMIMEYGSLRLSHDAQSLATSCSTRLVLRLQEAADAMDVRNFVGPNFTKDSLYAEIGEEGFAMLRDTYGVISTEMEEPVIDVLAGEFRKAGVPVHSALISAAIGAIPGKSFAETDAEKKLAADAESNAVKIAARALARIALTVHKSQKGASESPSG